MMRGADRDQNEASEPVQTARVHQPPAQSNKARPDSASGARNAADETCDRKEALALLTVALKVKNLPFAVADGRGGVRIIFPDGSATISREEGNRLLFHGRRLEKNGVALQLRSGYVGLERGGHRYSIAPWELAGLFRDRRGLALLIREVGV